MPIYGAIGASLYYFLENDDIMKTYRNAYTRRLSGYYDDEYLKIIPQGEEDKLLKGMKFHRSYRDISMLLLGAAYVLNIIEAEKPYGLILSMFSLHKTLTPPGR